MITPIKIVISGKVYDMRYDKDGNNYTVNPNHSDFDDIMPIPFKFNTNNRPPFLIVSRKAGEIGFEIINQIAIFEGRL